MTFVGVILLARLAGFLLLPGGFLPAAPGNSRTPSSFVPSSARGRDVRPAPSVETAWYGAAPYVMPLVRNAPDLVAVMNATGQKTFQLAFVLADHGSCYAAWDGTRSVGPDNTVAGVIDALRANGGDVSVALGGGLGTKLGEACPDATTTAAAYQRLVDRYKLRAIDFDLEDPEWRDQDAVGRELAAAATLQRNNPGLYVSLTLPGLPDRVAARAIGVLQTARDVGFVPDNVSTMPFDFHGDDAMGEAAVESLEALHEQLMATFGWSSAEAYRRAGASLMNGRTDHGEFYHPADFQVVLEYARAHGLGRFTYWSLNRDRACDPPDNHGKTSGACSSVGQEPWDFTRFTAEFGRSMAAAPAPGTATPTRPRSASTPARPSARPTVRATQR